MVRLKKPSARSFRQQRLSGTIHPLAPLKTFRPDAAPLPDSFSSSKRDKRLIKHSSFLSRVAESGVSKTSSSSSSSRKNKRTGRGRSKQLSTTLEGLADALPELQDGAEAAQGKIRHKSIKSKKGALKRKEQVVKGEMERFGVSMAQLAGTREQERAGEVMMKKKMEGEGGGGHGSAGGSSRWAALRGYISSTMEQNPAFAERQ
ncbi:uncharacterized protein BBA_03057 [Beauveria bassiana ARSEF 2860]|uniref:Ribosome biogenesis protein SLX9 n=1 Tax=Beauveria bassiana (strain ARSEF 2860) TaxID=655819 RepID=J5K1W6_BEAB2|nr:uncharacterized protein BBA_03057 [Beauveria bassiana ARSEF 2860]EJP68161.1 hypothetical protein BBA_03057 [Beauveria bassiana ARSEF 2860]